MNSPSTLPNHLISEVRVPVFLTGVPAQESRDFFEALERQLSGQRRFVIFSGIGPGDLSSHLKAQFGGIVVYWIHGPSDLQRFDRVLLELGLERLRGSPIQFLLVMQAGASGVRPRYPNCHVVRSDLLDVATEVQRMLSKVLTPLAAALPFQEREPWVNGRYRTKNNIVADVTPPLDHSADFWLLNNLNVLVKVRGHWLLRMTGPAPKAGFWKQEQDNLSSVTGGSGRWRWHFRSESERKALMPGSATWVFIGNEPVFRNGEWIFSGISPELGLYFGGQLLARRFSVSDSEARLFISANRVEALGWLPRFWFDLVRRGRAMDLKISREDLGSYLSIEKKTRTDKGFFKILDPEIIAKTLEYGRRHHFSAMIWGLSPEVRFTSAVLEVDLEFNFIRVRKPMGQAALQGLLRQIQVGAMTFYFRCCFGNEHVFFEAQLVQVETDALSFEVPPKMFEYQRRLGARYLVPREQRLQLLISHEAGDRPFRVNVLDISRGGCAILASEDEARTLVQHPAQLRILMRLDPHVIKCRVRARYLKPDPANGEGCYRVGLEFLDLDDWLAGDLERWILTQMI